MTRPVHSAAVLGLTVLVFGLVAPLGGCGTREENAAPTISKQDLIFKQMADNEEALRKAGKLPRGK
jgi:hypothetical protein